MFRIGRLSDHQFARLLATAQAAAPTYGEIGATLQGPLPERYGHVHRRVVVGTTHAAYDRACAALRAWQMHTRSGFGLYPDMPPLAVDTTVLVLLCAGPVTAVAPCRVVRVVDEPRRFGFAYGTLPGHPERGEEAFLVEQSPDGTITFAVTAFSRPDALLPRLGGPVTRVVQRRATRAYLQAMTTLAGGA
jgi:uncharacterized protein (UPF0548 family)